MIEEVEQPSDPVGDLKANREQLQVMIDRGDVVGTSLIADFYKKIEIDGKCYRTYALFVDVMEDSD